MAPDICFPLWVCWPLFGSNGGHSFRHTFRYVMVVTLADLRPVDPITGYPLATTPPPSSTTSAGIFASAIRVGTPDAETTLWISQVPKQETIGPLAACSTPGGLGDNAVWEGDPSRPPPYLLVQV